jgi:hypothetical protein
LVASTKRKPLFVILTDGVEVFSGAFAGVAFADKFSFAFLGIDFFDSISFGYGDFSMRAFPLTAAM